MDIDDLKVYQLAMDMGEEIWDLVMKWNYFEKDTVGKQLVKAIDSIAANLSEGFGRYHYREKINFGYYSRGSLYESKTWLTKAKNRDLIPQDDYDRYMNEIKNIGIKLNNYIKTTSKQSSQVKEDEADYNLSNE